jgi:hypothetical protein
VEITPQIADALPAFGGSTLGAVLRAAGVKLPLRARLHIYQGLVGTTVATALRLDRAPGGGRMAAPFVQPLTRAAAGLLLREPALGVDPPPTFLRSAGRIAAGQRFYRLEPLGGAAVTTPLGRGGARSGVAPGVTRRWVRPGPGGGLVVGFYLSEPDAQRIAEGLRQGRGPAALLQVVAGLTGAHRLSPRRDVAALEAEDEHDEVEGFTARGRTAGRGLRRPRRLRRLRRWILPAVSAWIRDHAEAFLRAAAHPDPGVTLRVQLSGLDPSGRAKPSVLVTVASGAAHR